MAFSVGRTLGVLGGVYAVSVVGMAVIYIKEELEARKKIAQIKAWEAEMLACIEKSKARLDEIASSPEHSFEDLTTAYFEEIAFLDIIKHQQPHH